MRPFAADRLIGALPTSVRAGARLDDVTHSSLTVEPRFDIEQPGTVGCLFYGLGADGTVGANKNSIKIIGEGTDLYTQGYFVYDSKRLLALAESDIRTRWATYEQLARKVGSNGA